MKAVQVWESKDGTLFRSSVDCIKHEEDMTKIRKILNILEAET